MKKYTPLGSDGSDQYLLCFYLQKLLLKCFFAKLHNIHNQSIKSLKVSKASSLQSLTMPEDPATIELNELGQRAGGSSPPIMVGGNAKRNKNCKTANLNI